MLGSTKNPALFIPTMRKKSTYKGLLIFGGLFLFLVLGACKNPDPNVAFIQGKWNHSEQVSDDFYSYIEWTFADGSFEAEGYPPLYHKGKYSVVKSEENKLTLLLTNQEGDWPTEDRELVIEIMKDEDQLKIGNTSPFTRVKKKD